MVSNMEKHYVFKSLFEDNVTQVSSIGRRTLRTTLKCMCHSAHIFWCSYSSRATRGLLVDNGCSSPELCNPIKYCLACRNLSIPPNVKMSSKNTLRYSSGIIVFNPMTPNDTYRGRTAPLTSKRSILYIYLTNICTEYFKRGIYSPFFSSKYSLFHNSNVFGS